jgi:hypothetical protein
VKLPDPELPCVAELVACTDSGGEAIALAECVAAGVVAAALVAGAEVGGAGAEADAVDSAATEPPEADPEAVGDFDPDPPQAVRPAPAMMTAMIATGTRRILMLLPSRE